MHTYNAAADMILPPIEIWALLSAVWFVHDAWNSRKIAGSSLLRPTFAASIAILLMFGILSLTLCGYVVLLLLLTPPLTNYFFVVVLKKHYIKPDAEAQIRKTGRLYLLCLLFAAILMLYLQATRTPEDLIIKWGADSPAVELIYDLYDSEPESLSAYRRILVAGDAFSAKLAAERIGDLGDSHIDEPLLEQALQKHSTDAVVAVAIEEALLRLRQSLSATASDKAAMTFSAETKAELLGWQVELRNLLLEKLMINDLLALKNNLELLPELISQTENAHFIRQRIFLNSTSVRRIEVILTVPVAASRRDNHPAVVVIHGHGSNKEVVYEYDDIHYHGFAAELAKGGYVTIAADVGQHEVFADGQTLVGERLWDLIRCVDYLESLPFVDSERVGCAGLSLGGQMAMWLGAVDLRIRAVVSAGFLSRMSHLDSIHCSCWQFDGLRELADFTDIYALIAPRALQLQIGYREPPWQFGTAQARKLFVQLHKAWELSERSEACELLIHEGGHEVNVSGMSVFFARQFGVEHSQLSFFNNLMAALRENAAMLLSTILLLMLAALLLA